MNHKLERYYNHIVDDLVKDTELDFENYMISFPWAGDVISITVVFQIVSRRWDSYGWFNIYMEERFGLRKKEFNTVYWRYMEEIKRIVQEYYDNQ